MRRGGAGSGTLPHRASLGRVRNSRFNVTGHFPIGDGIGLCLLGVALLGNLRQQLGAFVLVFLVAFGLYLRAAWLTLRLSPALAPAPASHPTARRPLLVVLAFGAAFRLVMLATLAAVPRLAPLKR